MTTLPAQRGPSTASPKPAILCGWRYFFPKMTPRLPIVFGFLIAWQSLAAENVTVLYTFTGPPAGSNPYYGALVRDAAGNLYGTTAYGGVHNQGAVFKISGETETVLHSFYAFNGGTDGALPLGGLILDSQGNLYGTTSAGGYNHFGMVFKLTSSGTYTVLHTFTTSASPAGGLVMDALGNLYGTTQYGGTAACNCGVVFKLTPTGTYTVLHSFIGGQDGKLPIAGLFMDGSGNLYGTTVNGGGSANCVGGCGTVFEVTSVGAEKVLYRFLGGAEYGASPYAPLTMDGSGNLYGTTYGGGRYGAGTVFMLHATAWSETVLHTFSGGVDDGADPSGGLVLDSVGNVYGTASLGGIDGGGIVFQLTPGGGETVLADFPAGSHIFSGLVLDSRGTLYGTTSGGGPDEKGTVFELP